MPMRRGQAARRAPPALKPAVEEPTSAPPPPSRWRELALRRPWRAKRLVLALSTLAAALSIVTLSTGPLEWISLSEDLLPATRCAMLDVGDPARPVLAVVTLIPVVALLFCAWCRPRSRLSLLLGVATLLLWIYRFHLRHAGC
jgi:hypothetical protein